MTGARLLGLLAVLCAFVGTIQAVALDGACTKDLDCSCTDAQATCQNALCKCSSGYTAVSGACKADIGTTCDATADCDTTTVTGTVCDTTMTSPVCKLGSAADCTNNQNDCVSNSACTSNACACTTTTHIEETATKLCKKDIGQSCTVSSDCVMNDLKAVCDTTVASPICQLGGAGDCTAGDTCMNQATCTGNACVCEATNYPADANTFICRGIAGQACSTDAGCAEYSECTSSTCSCMTGYVEQTDKSCLPGVGTACSATLACDITANANAVCDNTNVCKIKSGQACTASTDCVSGAACSTNCACSTGYTVDGTPALCLGDVGTSCSSNADCDQVTDALVCDLTLTSPVCKKKIADCSTTTNCVANSECPTTTTCACSSTYTLDTGTQMCEGAIEATCDTNADCDAASNLVCDTSSSKCKKGITIACTADQCMTNAECSSCGTCQCSSGYTYSTTNLVCEGSSATAAVYSTLMLMICFLITRV
ncbi:prion-like-(Q/N-rich) domain-bearing protein 25 [Mya arenaria]|uniref:prion-like-(Q/N-rich) domain-bearing protein 25 n=1 Tax=Mya arenaria TaxID=6604 RepID=UPI0022E79358|nr:prion-like-(Q/N-rich) domain-bearing protein 25 [Mya arenaria]